MLFTYLTLMIFRLTVLTFLLPVAWIAIEYGFPSENLMYCCQGNLRQLSALLLASYRYQKPTFEILGVELNLVGMLKVGEKPSKRKIFLQNCEKTLKTNQTFTRPYAL